MPQEQHRRLKTQPSRLLELDRPKRFLGDPIDQHMGLHRILSPEEGTGPASRDRHLNTFFGSLLCQQCFLKSILNHSCCSLSYCDFFSYALLLEEGNCGQLGQAFERITGIV